MQVNIGDVFGKLKITGFLSEVPKMAEKATFKCDCGIEKTIRLAHVVKGVTTSCGCIKQKFNVSLNSMYGRLTVISTDIDKSFRNRKIMCRCTCGTEKLIGIWELANGVTKSCGCLVMENVSSLKHGEEGTPLYCVWAGMKSRCNIKSSGSYRRYGGRGVSVCEEWATNYVKFRDWSILAGYKQGLQIDRKDNDGNYEPSNCRYVTPLINANNRGNHVLLTAFGETKTMSNWARDARCVVTISTLKQRITRGSFSHEAAITESAKKGPHGKSRIQKELCLNT